MTVALIVAAVLGWSLAIALLIGHCIALADQRDSGDHLSWLAASGDLPITMPVSRPGHVTWDGHELRWTSAPTSPAELAHAYVGDPDGLEAHCRREILQGRMTVNTLRRARALAEADS